MDEEAGVMMKIVFTKSSHPAHRPLPISQFLLRLTTVRTGKV